MAINLISGHIPLSTQLFQSTPVVSMIGDELTWIEEGSIETDSIQEGWVMVYGNMVCRITSIEVQGDDREITANFDPKFYKGTDWSGPTLVNFYNTRVDNIGYAMTSNAEVKTGVYSNAKRVYNYIRKTSFIVPTKKFHENSDILSVLKEEQLFLEDTCASQYSNQDYPYVYRVSLKSGELTTISNKGKFDLKFLVGMDNMYKI